MDKYKKVWDILGTQYKPRMNAIEKHLKDKGDTELLKKIKKMAYYNKIKFIDNLEHQGAFE